MKVDSDTAMTGGYVLVDNDMCRLRLNDVTMLNGNLYNGLWINGGIGVYYKTPEITVKNIGVLVNGGCVANGSTCYPGGPGDPTWLNPGHRYKRQHGHLRC